jgi:hypothetical protein
MKLDCTPVAGEFEVTHCEGTSRREDIMLGIWSGLSLHAFQIGWINEQPSPESEDG